MVVQVFGGLGKSLFVYESGSLWFVCYHCVEVTLVLNTMCELTLVGGADRFMVVGIF